MENFKLTLRPHWKNGSVAFMDVEASLSGGEYPVGKRCLMFTDTVVGIPFAEYEGLTLSDERGELPFEMREVPLQGMPMHLQGLFWQREVQGELRWSYRVLPRILPKGYSSSPYYDFRAEPGGLNTAGLTFLIGPALNEQFHLKLHWDLADMPAEARGVASIGTGDLDMPCDGMTLRFQFYAVGVMNSDEQGEFGIYWFGETPFDIRGVSGRIRDLFAYMSDFFHDDSPVYRVFLRRDPFEKSGGGTATTRSFMSGYSEKVPIEVNNWFCTLAHEMVHNWPHMADVPSGSGTWFMEGTAEYYSVLLPLRAGLTDAEETARQINRKAARYYTYPGRETRDTELAKIWWKDRLAQPVPYGRGMVYLANTEAVLQRKGAGSIDEIITVHSKNNPMTEEIWTTFIRERLGEDGLCDYADMKAGKLLIPDPDSFGGLFRVTEEEIELNGVPARSFRWEVKSRN